MSQIFDFNLSLSVEKTRSIYQGQVKYILVYTDQGLKIQLPAERFRTHVSEQGIHGRFRAETDDNNRLTRLVRI